MKLKHSVPDKLRKADQALLDENASLRQKLEKIEAASSAREDRLQILSSQIKIGFWEWDEVEDCAAFYSEEMAKIFGVSLTELYDRFKVEEDFISCIHPDDIVHYRDNMRRGREFWDLPGETIVFDYRIIRPDGKLRHLRELEYGAIKDKGRVTYSYGAIQDITEHQQSLAEQKLSEQRFSELISQLPIGIQEEDYSSIKKVVDKLRYKGIDNLKEYLERHPKILREMVGGTHITSVNEAILKIHQAESEQSFLEVEAEIDDWWDAEWVGFYAAEIDALAGPNKYYESERVDTRADGSYFEMRTISTLVRGHEDSWSRVITMHEDISDRKRNEVALIEAKMQAEKANLAKSEFLSCMSHELRTPLNAILGFSQLMMRDEEFDKEQQPNANRINHAGKHLLTLIDEILDLTQVESGEIELTMEPVSLANVLSESITWVDTLAKNLEVTINFDESVFEDVVVKADAVRLKQVFLNLLTNAVKYNNRGGSVSITCRKPGKGNIRIGIKDTGQGISQEHLHELFQPFNRLGAEFSSTEGTGIGLVITRKLVTLMDGRLDVRSTEGKGSVFWIELRSALKTRTETRVEIDPSRVGNGLQPVTGQAGVNPRILVAEDNVLNQNLIAAQLKSLGYIADYAANGNEALELLKSEKYDLLVTNKARNTIYW